MVRPWRSLNALCATDSFENVYVLISELLLVITSWPGVDVVQEQSEVVIDKGPLIPAVPILS